MDKTATEKVLENGGKRIVKDAKKNLNSQGKNSSNRLRGSLKSKVANDLQLEFYMEDYGEAVDQGRDGTKRRQKNTKSVFYSGGNAGGMPPVSNIKKWIKQKPVKIGSPKVDIDSVAFAMADKIKTQGIKPSMFFTNAYDKEMLTLPDKVAEAYANDAMAELDDELKDIKL